MSTAAIRRGREERAGEGALLDSGEFVAFLPGEQDAEGEEPAEREREESSFDELEGAAISEEADEEAAALGTDGHDTSFNLVEGGEISDNADANKNPEAENPRAGPVDNTAQAAQDEIDAANEAAGDDAESQAHTSADLVEGGGISEEEDGEEEEEEA